MRVDHSNHKNTRERPEAVESTRDRLLDVAERLFAEHGFESTPIRDITSAAGCNVASVNYHFGGKDNLYLEVFRRRLAALREQRVSALREALRNRGEGPSLELVVSTFTAAFLEPLVEENSRGRLLMQLFSREMLNPHLPRQVFVEEMIEPVMQSLTEALCTVCPELDAQNALRCGQSLVAQLVHVIHSRRFFGDGQTGPYQETDLNLMMQHISRFTAGGIRALAGGGSWAEGGSS